MSKAHRIDVDYSMALRLLVSDSDRVAIPVALRYSRQDPYAVTVAFQGEDVSVQWVFGRDLLIEGLKAPCGIGDVHVWPSEQEGRKLVFICLSSPDGQAVLEATADDVSTFLTKTAGVVAPGQESGYVDLDAQIAALLSVTDS